MSKPEETAARQPLRAYNGPTPELRPEHALVRLSPLSNLVPGHGRCHDWWRVHTLHSTPLMKLDFAVTRLACRFPMLSWRYAMPVAPTHRKRALDELACVHPNAAGLDIGSEEIVVAVPLDRDPQPVRVFPTFTSDLHALVAWLVA